MLTLYDFGNSVCCQKVRITMRVKGLTWDAVRVDLFKAEQYDPKYLKLNPKGIVPTLVHDGKSIIESTLICEYLDDTFPEPRLIPSDPWQRTRMRLWSKMVDEGLFEGVTELELLSHVPGAHAQHAGRNPRNSLSKHRRPAPTRPVHVDIRARRALALCQTCDRSLRARVQHAGGFARRDGALDTRVRTEFSPTSI